MHKSVLMIYVNGDETKIGANKNLAQKTPGPLLKRLVSSLTSPKTTSH
jgi:hypothetical protein